MEAVDARLGAPPSGAAADDAAAGNAQRPKWYLVYYLLALLDVVTVLASLTLNHRIMEIYVKSVAMSLQWEQRETEYARLSELATMVNAPGNDVFDSRDVRGESARLREALAAFNAQFAATQEEVAANVRPAEATMLLGAFDEIQRAMQEMTAEADLIFGYFKAGQSGRAGERMATMDRKYAGVHRALSRLFGSVRAIRQAHFEQQVRAAEWHKRIEYLIMGLAILMIAGALFYGSRISRGARAAEAERAGHMAALRRARAEADAANRAKSSFLAAVSHEIRTPLNSILLTLDLLEHPRSAEETQGRHRHGALVGPPAQSPDRRPAGPVADRVGPRRLPAHPLRPARAGAGASRTVRQPRRRQGRVAAHPRGAGSPAGTRGRSGALRPDPRQPGRQRGEVHREGLGRSFARAARAARRRHRAAVRRGARQRDRARAGAAGKDLRGFRAGRRIHRGKIRRHRTGPGHRAPAGAADERRVRRPEHPGRRIRPSGSSSTSPPPVPTPCRRRRPRRAIGRSRSRAAASSWWRTWPRAAC